MPPGPDVPVRAIGYVRVSMAREDMISPAIQQAAITAHAERSGRQVVAWVPDLDATGRHFRRKVQGAIERIERGEAQEILVYRYDRWGRNAAGAMANIARVEQAGGKVVSATEPLDPETAMGRYSRTNALAMAEMLSDLIGENWKAALGRRVSLGLPATGTPRFGYRRLGRVPGDVPHSWRRDKSDQAGERYEPHPETGPVLAELYARYTAGAPATALLRWLAGAGVTTLRGGPWTIQSLLSALDSGFAAGLLRVHDPGCGCRQPSRCKRSAFLPGAHEPLITQAQWQAYLARRAASRQVPPRARAAAYPLTGLARCGTCGGPLVAASADGQRGLYLRCNAWAQYKGCPGVRVRRSLAEAAVLGKLREWHEDIDAALAGTTARARATADADAARKRLAADVARADRELVRLLRCRAAADDDVPDSAWEQAKAELLAEREQAVTALAAAERTAASNGQDHRPVVRELLASWPVLPPAAKRDMLAKVISRVLVTRAGRREVPRIEVIPVWEDDLSLAHDVVRHRDLTTFARAAETALLHSD